MKTIDNNKQTYEKPTVHVLTIQRQYLLAGSLQIIAEETEIQW